MYNVHVGQCLKNRNPPPPPKKKGCAENCKLSYEKIEKEDIKATLRHSKYLQGLVVHIDRLFDCPLF